MKSIRTAAIAAINTFSLSSAVDAAPLDPNAFAAIGTLGGGAIVIDTDALTVNGGGGGILVPQGGAPFGQQSGGPPDIAVFSFGGGSVLGDVTITGSRAATILFRGAGTLTGTIDVSGQSVGNTSIGGASALGGGGGGVGEPFGFGTPDGFGPGGGNGGTTAANIGSRGPGSGGGFGTAGGDAGAGTGFQNGGVGYGDIVAQLTGGSGGGGGGGHFNGINVSHGGGGGAGGGALEIGALTDLILTGATLSADGGDGGARVTLDGGGQVDAVASGPGGGGGSGGGILLHGFNISIDAASLITANGGDGGWAGLFETPDGSCGGGGRIAVISNTAGSQTVDGTVEANAGSSGQGVACNFFSTPLFLTDPEIGEGSVIAMSAPASFALLGMGLGFMAWRRRR